MAGNKWFDDFEKTLPSMKGKVVAITGCTSGTGIVAARTMARKDATVLMLNRPSTRATAAAEAVRSAASPDAQIVAIDCDLSDFENVRAAAKDIRAKFKHLDVLCNNAGVAQQKDRATPDGYDVQMKTNHLSHMLLTKELYPLLEEAAQKSGEARVVSMSSEARSNANMLQVLLGQKASGRVKPEYYGKNGGNLGGNSTGLQTLLLNGPDAFRYHQSKLANCVFTYALHDRLKAKGSKVKAVVAHPGGTNTDLMKNSDTESRFMQFLIENITMTQEDGTIGLLMAMCSEGVESGDFFGPKGIKGMAMKLTPEPHLYSEDNKRILWEESCKAVGEFQI